MNFTYPVDYRIIFSMNKQDFFATNCEMFVSNLIFRHPVLPARTGIWCTFMGRPSWKL